MPTTIYCDEAGFTGNNLLDVQQPYFCYASVAIDPAAAAQVVDKAIRDFRIDGKELKGQRLLGSNRGRKAVSFVVGECVDRAKVSLWHKRYTLASKFFEHIFEPVLAQQNSIFYGCGFHRFISNIIYFESLVNIERAAKALERFQVVMRAPLTEGADSIFPASALGEEYSEVIRQIETFALCHREKIATDVADHGADNSLYRWLLEVSVSALWALLTAWGEQTNGDSLVVYCDESKPLYENRSHFDIMIGRTDRKYVTFEDKQRPLIYNLAEPINFVSSHDHAGIQIADVIASATNYAFRNSTDVQGKALMRLVSPALEIPVFPDTDVVDLQTPAGFVNALVLHELVDRSIKQENLFEGMPEFIRIARDTHPRFLSDPLTSSRK